MAQENGSGGFALLLLGLLAIGVLIAMKRKPTMAQSSNEEVWEWTDWQGMTRQVTVHRKVKQE